MISYDDLLTIYKHPFNLVRLGFQGDGGYVVPEELINDNLLSFGIADEISFEEDYIKRVAHPNIHCFDGTIERFPSENPLYCFHKINVGQCDTDNEVSIDTIFENYFKNQDKVFFKMDIEGSEYPSLMAMSQENLRKIDCMVLEVHGVSNYELFSNLMYKLNSELVLIHRHINECGGFFYFNGQVLSQLYELTFVNKNHFLEKNDIDLPIEGLDFPNSN